MPRTRDAWLAAIAAALGVSDAACKREASVTTTITPVTSTVTSAAPSASATTTTIVETTEAPSASAVEVASAKPVPTVQPRLHPLSCGATVREPNAICGASPMKNELMEGPTVTVQTNVTSTNEADRALASSLKPRMRSCAMRALAQDPTEVGKVVVSATIDATGTVNAASITTNNGLAAGTAACMVTQVRAKQFPAGAPRTIQVQIQTTRHE